MTGNWSNKLIALLLVATVGFPFDCTSDAVSEYFEANLQQIKKSYEKSLEVSEITEDTTIDVPQITSIDENATLGRSRADFLDFFNDYKSHDLSEDIIVSYIDLLSIGIYLPNLLSSLLLNIPPPFSFV
ncbi:hypothetical protein [Leptospira bouyouniensis]|uniref:TIGR04452 family lipoprotein n=1 Tax=Leptospira bouyouniensis TaxID=2484911 RepID=A0ABY2L132_9LEPT|nr:hypothetical protein [Leptospira bouyouniensis]TGK46519.1 hypothetical protein EHQ10_14165 [Leptospira bouyouniensis]TGM79622.1 hypothetical protein EHQ99_07710 [Leptospira bouyouniensis]